MGGFITSSIRNAKANLEALSLAQQNGADNATLAALQTQVETLVQANQQLPETPPATIDNWLADADFDHSVNSFTGAGATDELYRWFRAADPARPVKDAGTNPLWNKDEGWVEWSVTDTTDDLSYQFGKRLIRPGQSLFLMFNVRIKNNVSGRGVGLNAGIWDSTTGIENWVGASLSGGSGLADVVVTKIGPGAATTTYTYVLVATTDRNEVIVSTPASVVGAGGLNTTDYNQIIWQQASGILRYSIYRITPNPGLVGIVDSGGSSFNDQGVLLQANAAIPSPSSPLAKVNIPDFGNRLNADWQTVRTRIYVPRNYNMSLTDAAGQWLRLGLTGTSDAIFEFDRMGLSLTPGIWAPSPEDRLSVNDTVIAPTTDGQQGPDEATQFWWLGRLTGTFFPN